MVSTKTGSEGRNLQFANHMVNYDLPWNPMRIEQRIGRIHRIGQEKNVHTLGVLLPEDLFGYFGEEQLLLTFDYEVAEETEGSLFITHGSPFLDKTVESILQSYGRFTGRYWSGG